MNIDGGLSKSEIDEVLNKNKLTAAAASVFREFHSHYFVDDAFSDSDVILLAIYLREGLGVGESGDAYKVRGAYLSLGRASSRWENAVRQAEKNGLIEQRRQSSDTFLRMLVPGVKHIENIFGLTGTKHYIFKSGKTFTAQKRFEDFLKAEIEKGEIILCDPYVSPSTLYPFSELWGRIDSLKILTSNISEKDKFQSCIKALEDEHGIKVEVKINLTIHDRFLISGNKCWIIGTSIKDLGNKDCVLKEISEIAQSLTDLFWERWKEST